MHRLVIATTALLTMIGAVVVAGYLFIFAAQADRAAAVVPAETPIYATLYLQPSTGQKMNLAALLGRVPGFADAALLDQKIHEITARFMGQAGIDYEADVRPWLGDQVSLAVQPHGPDPGQADVLVLVQVVDPAAAGTALARMAPGTTEAYEGVEVTVAGERAWAVTEEFLLLGSGRASVERALDAAADRATSLADAPRFGAAMDTLPPDHVAALFVDLEGLAAESGTAEQLGGYSTAAAALVVEPDGLRLAGSAPFDTGSAGAPAREAFALSGEPSSLSEWMPQETQAELVVFGLAQSLRGAEEQLGTVPGTREIAAALDQLRAIAALGLGISLDDDLLPLFDRDAALALVGLDTGRPRGQLLLRPSDADGAQAALERMRDALADRGAAVDQVEAEGQPITVVDVPQLGRVAYAVRNGVVVAGLSEADVTAALAAEAGGGTLADSERYRAAWELAGDRAGNELWVDAAALVDAAESELGVTGEARDILLEIGAVAMTAPARRDRSEFYVVVTVR